LPPGEFNLIVLNAFREKQIQQRRTHGYLAIAVALFDSNDA